jgi:hypothetical protein
MTIPEKEILRSISYYTKEIAPKCGTEDFDDDSIYCLGILTGLFISLGKGKEFTDMIRAGEEKWANYVINLLKTEFKLNETTSKLN